MELKDGTEFLHSEMVDDETMARAHQKALIDVKEGRKAWALCMGWISEKLPLTTKRLFIQAGVRECPLEMTPEYIKGINSQLEDSYNGRCYYFFNVRDKFIGWLAPITKEETEEFNRCEAGDVEAMGKFWWLIVQVTRGLNNEQAKELCEKMKKDFQK